jgi:PPK2 family polyphosphate:nucleotide phosphotransferase
MGRLEKFSKELRVAPGRNVKLAKLDSGDTYGWERADAEARVAELLPKLYELQYKLYAEDRQALLIVLQAMDAGGKDSTIRKVMGGLNPQGTRVDSFKVPTDEELAHDFLWRIHRKVPEKGHIGIFNRSQYGDVLVVRVHDLVPDAVWRQRYKQINDFEKILADNHTRIAKFFLHISKEEQRERLQERFDDPLKHWKASMGDLKERRFWDDYQEAYEVALEKCSTDWAPWYVIPADRKWFRNLAVSSILVETLEDMDIEMPVAEFDVSNVVVE